MSSEKAEQLFTKTFSGLVLIGFAFTFNLQPQQVTSASVTANPSFTEYNQPIKTETRFGEKTIDKTEIIPKKTVYKDDPDTEAGMETVLEEGEDGKIIQSTKVTYYEGKEYKREVVDTKKIPAKDKVISRGTKIVWRELETPDGQLGYWKKLRVWATHYDSRCPGCDEWTATGMRAGKGVIAVDPKVIKLGSKVYIPGYGLAIAGDTGGAIKGNIIDLGFEDARTAGWSARFVEIYILN